MRWGNPFGGLGIDFPSPLGMGAWFALAGVPVGIILLYFLKLRRRPVQVPSTLLWRRSVEDLHVNSLFQRLRRNLLLFLQLLAVGLTMLALAAPTLKGTSSVGRRYVIAIDNSASMSSTDIGPSRLADAQRQATELVDRMGSGDVAMVLAFADRARVVSNYTSDRRELKRRIAAIQPTDATTSLREALQVAAGLANPQRQFGEGETVGEVVPPKLVLMTDGGFADVEGFSLGNLEPEVVVIGPPPPAPAAVAAKAKPKADGPAQPAQTPSDNVAILALQTGRNEDRPDEFQVFGRVRNFRDKAVTTQASLIRRDPSKPDDKGELVDAIELTIPAQDERAFEFNRPDTGSAELEVRLDVDDSLPLDNRAFTLIGMPRKAQVLLVTGGNRYLTGTLRTEAVAAIADVAELAPDQLATDDAKRDLASGRYDLVLFDGVRPEAPPAANALYFGALPAGREFPDARPVEGPVILDWDIGHPLMQYIRDLADVRILKATGLDAPPGADVLIEGDKGPLAFVLPREGFADVVLTFPIMTGKDINTDWPRKYSFPLFLFHCLRVLGNVRESSGDEVHRPGDPVVLRADSLAQEVVVTPPGGRPQTIKRSPQGTFVYNQADAAGLYNVSWGESGRSAFAVNLFDPRESDLATRGLAPPGTPADQQDAYKIQIGHTTVAGTQKTVSSRREWWKPIALAALGVLLFEWYIYNRKVYL